MHKTIVAGADSQAASLGYDVVEYTDTVSNDVYHGLHEQTVGGVQKRGWGSFFVNLDFQADALFEVPHPKFDTNSWDVGAKAFRGADARGFLMAGAHRNANGTGTADVEHLAASIFQEVHDSWVGTAADTDVWQVHGFIVNNHSTFPAGADAVLSNGGATLDQFTIVAGTSPTASLAAPLDNGPRDVDPIIDAVTTGFTHATFDIQLSDDQIGIDDASVAASSVTVTRDTVTLIEGADYTFAYDATSDLITLGANQIFDEATYQIQVTGVQDQSGNVITPTTLESSSTSRRRRVLRLPCCRTRNSIPSRFPRSSMPKRNGWPTTSRLTIWSL